MRERFATFAIFKPRFFYWLKMYIILPLKFKKKKTLFWVLACLFWLSACSAVNSLCISICQVSRCGVSVGLVFGVLNVFVLFRDVLGAIIVLTYLPFL